MIRPSKVAQHGRLGRTATKAVLVAAVAGYLSFGGGTNNRDAGDGFSKKEINQEQADIAKRKRILADDEEVFLIIQTFIKCQ